ncbi:MAG TPA: glycosyltransferase family 4 protein [Mycobacteriales bacterium]|jgi:glycosyltransferase involved in cell wall biosynthesis|nr:glycosyltransferase family 4 protein [Mycobacteriales bacterium]
MAEFEEHRDTIGYVLKGYPRISELFIASEIWRLEQLGLPLRLFVLKPAEESDHHPVVDKIEATPSYLPDATSLSNTTVPRWLRENFGSFRAPLGRYARKHPVKVARTAATALRQAIRARKGLRPRSIYLKEFLQAVDLADRLDQAGDVRHLHAHFAHGTTTVTWLASMLTGLPFSFTGHAKDIYRESLNPAGLLPRKMRAASFVVTCTGANKAHLQRLEPTADVHLIYHGLNADFAALLPAFTGMRAEARRIEGDDDEEPEPARSGTGLKVVAVGRMVPKKGFDVLVEAVADLRDRGVDLELVIAGEDGPDAGRIRALVAERCPELVRFTGPLTQCELLELYRSANVFALACRVDGDGDRDGIPNVMVEAMAAGLPVVSTAVSGIPELVRDGENGLLVPPEDPAALAGALLKLAADAPLRDRLAAAGRATVAERFDGDVLARRMAGLFHGGRP